MVYTYIYLLAILNHAITVVTAVIVNLLHQLSDILSIMFQYELLIAGLLTINVVAPLEHCKSGKRSWHLLLLYI